MRRKVANITNSRQKAFVYTCALIGLTVYGVPRLPRLEHGLAGTFTLVWLLFVALCVGANLYFLFGADKERKRLLEQQEVASQSRDLRHEVQRLRG
ncbi:hypothetical protein NZD89_05475 [Alicyclobacillus fastidiosus]|uniref:Uncharacterized protein n=1 Tax=Alicyclobacillus fastidiosus TaxID=392011 RepID=A0ABY6ZJ34_9BACL|nr:hypothetical protein [Alicyclobacillus fastidiosus]WAH42879.1 hypothetical protein NZD89_05475 [Alicyclobacillus fastidiosus]GMA64818.1 hypothetical protein GCM10025859_52580 [Alicyclobacillus fastidiosus]